MNLYWPNRVPGVAPTQGRSVQQPTTGYIQYTNYNALQLPAITNTGGTLLSPFGNCRATRAAHPPIRFQETGEPFPCIVCCVPCSVLEFVWNLVNAYHRGKPCDEWIMETFLARPHGIAMRASFGTDDLPGRGSRRRDRQRPHGGDHRRRAC